MSQRIYWESPQDLTPSTYSIYIVGTSEQLLATIPNNIPSPYWLEHQRRFTFEDPSGTDATIYRVRGFGPAGELYADTGPFQPSAARAATLASRKMLNHDYGAIDALRYVAPNGAGVPDANIRVFLAVEWDAGRRNAAQWISSTDGAGRWKTPVWVEPGQDVYIVFERAGAYGPDGVRVTV